MPSSLHFRLSVQDAEASAEELQLMVQILAAELENHAAVLESIASSEVTPEMLTKGEDKGSILDVKIDLDALKSVGQWLYDRLLGTPTEVKFEYQYCWTTLDKKPRSKTIAFGFRRTNPAFS